MSSNENLPSAAETTKADWALLSDRSLARHSKADASRVSMAYQFIQKHDIGREPLSQAEYLKHIISVVDSLGVLNADSETICAGILQDVPLGAGFKEQVIEQFGQDVTELVAGVIKIKQIAGRLLLDFEGRITNPDEVRQSMMSVAEDAGVIVIYLSDCMQLLRQLVDKSRQGQVAWMTECEEIAIPLANYFGIWQFKWEMEDYVFLLQEPMVYRQVARLLDEKRADRETYITILIDRLNEALLKAGIDAEVDGRPKHIYSIYKKMKRKGVGIDKIYDVRALRVRVENISDCYTVLGVAHTLWKPIPGEFDDYIARPKENNYQSLHTAVIGPEAKTVEVQIRTRKMHEDAELGVAAHWQYKEGRVSRVVYATQFERLKRNFADREMMTARDVIDGLRHDLATENIYVLTPKNLVVELPIGSTALDFAYRIHTDLGNTCRGCRVDGKISPLNLPLKNGQTVQVLTSTYAKPSREWLDPDLGFAHTTRAKSAVKRWFVTQGYDESLVVGKHILENELHRLGLSGYSHEELAQKFRLMESDKLYSSIGRGEINNSQIASAMGEVGAAIVGSRQQTLLPVAQSDAVNKIDSPKISGVGNMPTEVAGCCKPLPNDPIIGLISQNNRVLIHRQDCANILNITEAKQPYILEVNWAGESAGNYSVDIHITAYDRQALLRDITHMLARENINVISGKTVSNLQRSTADISLTVIIQTIGQLSRALARINQLSNIIDVERV